MLYMTVGERNDRVRAQNTNIHGGKVLRLKDDGTVPPDNPFVGKAGFKPEIYTLRPPQPAGARGASRHRRRLGNRTRAAGRRRAEPGRCRARTTAGRSITFGREYSGEVISAQPAREGIEQPFMFWAPSPGLSGMVIYSGDKFAAGRASSSSARSPASACGASA